MNGYFRFKKRFYGLSDIPTLMIDKINQILNYQTPVRLDGIILVKRGDKEKDQKKLFTIFENFQETGYRGSKKKSEFFLRETTWLGQEIRENGIQPKKTNNRNHP